MKFKALLLFIFLVTAHYLKAQTIQHTYRFYRDLFVAQPECGPIIAQAKANGNCPADAIGGQFVEDVLPCGSKRVVYQNNLSWGLMYPNTEGAITDNYTIQMYIKVTDCGNIWARIIDFSNGTRDEGVYFKSTPGSTDRCLDFYPSGIAGACPFFNKQTYYLLTFTRNGRTGMVDVYVDTTLFTSYDDSRGSYVGQKGTPIYIFRDDDQKTCESGTANFAYLSFNNKYASKEDVDAVYKDICFVANINSYADFSITPNPICDLKTNATIAYTGLIKSPGTDYTFNWEFDGATIVSGSGMGPYVVNWNNGGVKNVSLTVTSKCGNYLYNQKHVPVSTLDLETNTIAGDCIVGQTPTVKLSGTDGLAPYTYSLDAVNYKPDSIYNLPIGNYKAYVKDKNGCTVQKDFVVEYNGDIQVAATADSLVCFGESSSLHAGGNAQKFLWSPPTGLDDPNAQSPVANPLQTTAYIVTATKGSCIARDTVVVTVRPKIEVIATPDSLVQMGVPIVLDASSPQIDPKDATYNWSPPEGLSNPNIQHPTVVLDEGKTFTVEITSPDGCKGSADVSLSIFRPESIFLPTAFTPNKDGKNEIFIPIMHDVPSLSYFRIFNRWGQLVFFTNQLDTGWDGYFKGASPIIGTYVWEIEGVTEKGKVIRKSGSVMLIL